MSFLNWKLVWHIIVIAAGAITAIHNGGSVSAVAPLAVGGLINAFSPSPTAKK